MKFVSRPVEIEAVRVTEVLKAFADNTAAPDPWVTVGMVDGTLIFAGNAIRVRTFEGEMLGKEGDWLIRGTEGELYPCKASIFERKYQEIV